MRILSNIKKQIPIDFLQVFTFDMLAKIFMGVISVILIRYLTKQGYADYTKFTVIANFIIGVFGTGIALSYVRYSAEMLSRDKKNQVNGLYFLSSVTLFLLLIISFTTLPILKEIYFTKSIIIGMAFIYGFAMSMIKLNQFYYQARELYVNSGIIGNLRNILIFSILIIMLILFKNLDEIQVMFIYIISAIITLFLGSFKIYKNFVIKDVFENLQTFKLMIKEGIWLIVYASILNLFNQMDVLMLTNMSDDISVASYGVAFRYYSLLLTMLPSIKSVLRVRTSKKEYVDNIEKRYSFTTLWLRKTYKLIILACLILILFSDFYMPILNGEMYNSSIPVYKILVIGVGISYLFAPNVSMMMSGKRYKTLCIIAFFALCINILGNYMLIPIIDARGAALTTVVSQGFLNIISTIIVIMDARKDSYGDGK